MKKIILLLLVITVYCISFAGVDYKSTDLRGNWIAKVYLVGEQNYNEIRYLYFTDRDGGAVFENDVNIGSYVQHEPIPPFDYDIEISVTQCWKMRGNVTHFGNVISGTGVYYAGSSAINAYIILTRTE